MTQSAVVITPTRLLCRLCTDVAINRPRRICDRCLAEESHRAFAECDGEGQLYMVYLNLLRATESMKALLNEEKKNGREKEGNTEGQGESSRGLEAPSGSE